MSKNDTGWIKERFESLETRIDMLNSDVMGLKSRVPVLSDVAARIDQIKKEVSDMYYDVNNKIASVRGTMAVQERIKKKDASDILPSTYNLPAEEYEMLQTMGLNEKAIQEYCRNKALMEQVSKFRRPGQPPTPAPSAQQKGLDTSKGKPGR